jgi:hypothetical protein
MTNPTCLAVALAGITTLSLSSAFADEVTSAENTANSLRSVSAAVARSVGINTTWAETGVSATGIASSDFLHNDMTKPAAKPRVAEKKAPAIAPASAPAEVPEIVAEAPVAPAPDTASKPASKPVSKPSSAPKKRSTPPRSTASALRKSPQRSYGGGKDVVTGGGKEIYVEDMLSDPAPALFEISVDAGYQSRYYYLGANQILNANDSATGNLAQPEDTDVYYTGVSAHWNGFGGSVKYVRGTNEIETRFSKNPVNTTYEEIVTNLNYTLAVLPDGWMNVTGGYRAIFFDEETFYNAGRQDDLYVTIANSVFPLLRPSITYHYLDQDSPPGVGQNTTNPGEKSLDGQILVLQIDGQVNLPQKTGLPFDVIYYAQAGFDNEYNLADTDWDHDWTQVGVTLPIFCGPFTISPNWSYSERANKNVGRAFEEHFWGVNVRFDF